MAYTLLPLLFHLVSCANPELLVGGVCERKMVVLFAPPARVGCVWVIESKCVVGVSNEQSWVSCECECGQ